MAIQQLPIFTYYDKQQFTQFGTMDCANWYGVAVEGSKQGQALYPCMGRKHVSFMNQNKLVYTLQPRAFFKTINYLYVVVGTTLFQYDRFYNEKTLGSVALIGELHFDYLPVGTLIYGLLTDGTNIFVITEDGSSVTFQTVTDPNAPGGTSTGGSPQYVAAFGNRFVVSVKDRPDYYLTRINLFSNSGTLADCFTIDSSPLFNQATGIVRQMDVLHAQLYIFTDFTCNILSNIPTQISVTGAVSEFPWKVNTSYNWDYGMEDPLSLAVGFGRMVWLGKNADGLVSFMASNGNPPEDISSQAVNVLLEQSNAPDGLNPFLDGSADGFLYQYNNTIFYRVVAGQFLNFGILDEEDSAHALEYNFETKKWGRVIELNGERNRIQKHIYFNNKHFVIVEDDPAIYEMSGNIFHNELRNLSQADRQATDAFTKFPMRYELTTQQFSLEGYAEFIDDYVEIDFVFGDQTFYRSNAPFDNTVFIVSEESTDTSPVYILSEDDKFLIKEGTNIPTFDDNHYNALFKPFIELSISDDGGVTFTPVINLEFSPLGMYRWRMRWCELGTSRNRCYKLVCVSSAPIVILGAVRNTRRASGGAN